MEKRHNCGDCGAEEGAIHKYGCDMERCPFCGHQLISCDCIYERLGLDCSPGSSIYTNGPSEAQEEKWLEVLEDKGRVPYIVYPNICARCGKLWPDMFRVDDERWKGVVEISERSKMLCWPCFEEIETIINSHRRQ